MPDWPSEAADRLAIMDLLSRYSRGVDRCDLETLRSVWWPDATADYWGEAINAFDWSAATVSSLRANILRTQHFLGNIIIALEGHIATGETYCQAYHEISGADRPVEMTVGGRYLDRFEKRDGEWRIAARRYVMDWNRNTPSTAQWSGGIYDMLKRTGARMPDDPLYTGA